MTDNNFVNKPPKTRRAPNRDFILVAKRKMKDTLVSIVHLLVVFGICFIILLPLIQKVASMFMSEKDLYDVTVAYLPKHFSLKFVRLVLDTMRYGTSLPFSLVFSAVVALSQTMVCSFVAYGFARFKFPLRGFLFGMVLFTLIVPPSVTVIAQYANFRNFNPLGLFGWVNDGNGFRLLNTIWPLVLPSLTAVGYKNALFIFILRQFYMGFPKSLEEAATIDGIRTVPLYFKIALPSALSMLTTCFLLGFIWQYTDVYYSNFFMTDMNTISVRLSRLVSEAGIVLINTNQLRSSTTRVPTGYEGVLSSAGVILTILPLMVVYVFAQRFFTENIETSGIK